MTCDASRVLQAMQTKAIELTGEDVDGGVIDREEVARAVVEALATELPQASWTGVYWQQGRELVLGPFVGPATEHTRIPFGHGVCGTAAARGEDQVVDDVAERAEYLACAVGVRSELVVLIRAGHTVIGQFDLDAEAVGAFDQDDHCVVRAVADALGGLLGPDPTNASTPDA